MGKNNMAHFVPFCAFLFNRTSVGKFFMCSCLHLELAKPATITFYFYVVYIIQNIISPWSTTLMHFVWHYKTLCRSAISWPRLKCSLVHVHHLRTVLITYCFKMIMERMKCVLVGYCESEKYLLQLAS